MDQQKKSFRGALMSDNQNTTTRHDDFDSPTKRLKAHSDQLPAYDGLLRDIPSGTNITINCNIRKKATI